MEYGLLAALIAVVIIGGVTLVGSNLSATFKTVSVKVSPSPTSDARPAHPDPAVGAVTRADRPDRS